MAWTQTDIDALKAMQARGIKRGRMPGGEEVEFHDVESFRKLLAMMEADVAGSGSGNRAVTAIYPKTGRGL